MGRSPGKRSKSRSTLVALAVLLGFFSAGATARNPETIYVACAANFYAPIKALVERYRQEHGNGDRILISSGSSGSLFRQIQHGSPHQIFLSADSFYPKKLEDEKLTIPGSRQTYAIGELVLWHPGVELDSLEQLAQYEGLTLAIANPKTAPYGKAAQQVLNRLSTNPPWRLVIGASIAQTHQFVGSNNAQAGLISRSQIEASSSHTKTIPDDWYPPLVQQMVMTRKAKGRPAVEHLYHYLSSHSAHDIIVQHGYRLPESEP